jgi:predicted DNA-binding transcriptional regulator AlpA
MRRLNTASVMERLDISSRETIRQLVRRKLLPAPMKDSGGGQNFWLESDIDAYLQSQAEARDRANRAPELSQQQAA